MLIIPINYLAVKYTYYGETNAVIQLSNDSNQAFLKGCCTIWALEAHRQSGLPIVTFDTVGTDIRNGGWTGHAALKIDDDNYFDAAGVSQRKGILFDFDKKYNIDDTPVQ